MQINIGETIVNLPLPYGDINFYFRPENWVLSEHSHPYYQLLLIIDGMLELKVDGSSFQLQKGSLCIIPPLVKHSLYTERGYSQFGINLHEQNDDRGINALVQSKVDKFLILNKSDWFNILPILRYEATNLSQLSKCKTINILDNLMISCIQDITSKSKEDFGKKLLEILNGCIRETITLAAVAKSLSLSQTQLERLCNREFGCSVLELFNQLKTNKAYSLLSDRNRSIAEISDYLGFCEQAYFCRFFKKRTGMTPSSYRKQNNH